MKRANWESKLVVLAATILTRDNEKTIGKTLESLRGLVDELILVDDGSNDQTLDVVKGVFPDAKIFFRKLDDFASQRNFSLSKCSAEWVVVIDSDEFLDEELKLSILRQIQEPAGEIFVCKRWNRNLAGWGVANMQRPILVRKSHLFHGALHEVVPGKTKFLKGKLYHDCWDDVDGWVDDMQKYAYWKAKGWAQKNPNRSLGFLICRQFAAAGYLFLKRFIAEKRYRQGLVGFLYCFTWSFEEFLVALKYYEITRRK